MHFHEDWLWIHKKRWHSPLIFTNRKALERNRSAQYSEKKSPKTIRKIRKIQINSAYGKWADAWCHTTRSWSRSHTDGSHEKPNTFCISFLFRERNDQISVTWVKTTRLKLFQVNPGGLRQRKIQPHVGLNVESQLCGFPSAPFNLKARIQICKLTQLLEHIYNPKISWKSHFRLQSCSNKS